MSVNWLTTGAKSQELQQKAATEAALREQSRGGMFRFFVKPNEEARFTFIDGDLDSQGMLVPPRYFEHNLYLGGKWGNTFVCPHLTNPDLGYTCPICEDGDIPYLAALFTVIDHRTVVGRNNKTYKDMQRLFVAKPKSFELLSKIALKRGGLAGATFDAMRLDKKDPGVGSQFDFIEKRSITDLRNLYTKEIQDPNKPNDKNARITVTAFEPANYATEIQFRTPEELLKLGIGKGVMSGSPHSSAQASAPAGMTDHMVDGSEEFDSQM